MKRWRALQSYNMVCWVCGTEANKSWDALRKHQAGEHLAAAGLPARAKWDQEEFLVPVFENDHLLWVLESAHPDDAGDAAPAPAPAPQATQPGPLPFSSPLCSPWLLTFLRGGGRRRRRDGVCRDPGRAARAGRVRPQGGPRSPGPTALSDPFPLPLPLPLPLRPPPHPSTHIRTTLRLFP